MNKQHSSAEFSQPDPASYGKGDRVRFVRGTYQGEFGTVVYFCKSARGHSVTVEIDNRQKKIVVTSNELERSGALF